MRLQSIIALAAFTSCLNVASSPDGIFAITATDFVVNRDRYTATHPYAEELVESITPAFSDAGVLIGIRVSRLRPDGVYARLGLQDGDVVVKANGLPLTTPDMALSAYSSLREEREIEVTVLRDGRRIALRYSVE